MHKIILALDQATNDSGWSLFLDNKLNRYGIIQLNGFPDDRMNQMKSWLHLQIESLKLEYENKDILIVLEDIQLQQNVMTFKTLAQLQGILINEIFISGLDYKIYSSSEWKKTCGVKGRSKPEQKRSAKEFVQKIYNIDIMQDTCDAICLGYHASSIDSNEISFK